jgi:hypothetical protein
MVNSAYYNISSFWDHKLIEGMQIHLINFVPGPKVGIRNM